MPARVGMDRNQFHFGHITFELHIKIPSRDNIRPLSLKRGQDLKDKLDSYQQAEGD